MAISRLGFNIPSNILDRQRSGQLFFDVLILFCGEDLFSHLELSHGRLPNIWLTGVHSDPSGTIRTPAYGLLKKAASPGKQFLVAPAPISSQFHYPRPPSPTLACSHARPKPPYYAGQYFDETKYQWLNLYLLMNLTKAANAS